MVIDLIVIYGIGNASCEVLRIDIKRDLGVLSKNDTGENAYGDDITAVRRRCCDYRVQTPCGQGRRYLESSSKQEGR